MFLGLLNLLFDLQDLKRKQMLDNDRQPKNEWWLRRVTVALGSTSIVNFFCWRSLNVRSMITEPGRRKSGCRTRLYNMGQGTSADGESVDDCE